MKKHFYSHLIEMEPIITVLDEVTITNSEKKELLTIVESTTHYLVTDIVLSELSEVDKKKFLTHLSHDDHDEIWALLTNRIEKIENKIRSAIRDVHLSMIDDVKKISKKSTH